MSKNKTDQTMQKSDFVHLHNHTHYSLLDGLQKIPDMVKRVKDLGMEAVALTDHGSLSGVIEFYQEAKAQGIKPIIGMEAYLAPRQHTQKEGKKDSDPYHLILLAMNNQGYQNLMQLSTISHLEGFYYKPRIDRELLEEYHEGLIVLSGCINSEVGDRLRRNQLEQAKDVVQWYRQLFGDRYYLELQDHAHEWQAQAEVNDQLVDLAAEFEVPLVVTADAHYSQPEDQEAHEVLLCVQTGSELDDENRMSLEDMHLYLTEPEEIIDRWGSDFPEAITNTREIADRCQVEIDLGQMLIPEFEVPTDESERAYLHRRAFQGLAWRYGGKEKQSARELSIEEVKSQVDSEIIERLEYELDVIGRMDYDGYFLIVADFINWGKDQGIIFGPGRGSAAGSIVSYALGITDIDPLKYDLLFERFLNPERISMPDIDIDIMDTRRDEVIEYTVDKYGESRVAHIVTFGTMAARNAIRDTARVLGVPYSEADRLAKMVPPPNQGRHIPLAKSIKEQKELKQEYESNPQSKRVMDLAIRLEGTIRSHGVHAAGVVIAPDEITNYTPLEVAQKGVVTTQYSMGPIEDLGLLKMDFLGLSNLTIIKNALRIIRKVYENDIDLEVLPRDDAKTYELLSRGDTTGVFQLESAGMKRYIKELEPDNFEDIIAMVSLYRPGPLTAGLTQKFIDRKNGQEKVSYQHETMKPALESTYGVLVYQEQVMRIAQDMCGFSGGQADTLRKAIGKKKRKVMAKMREEFIEGAIETSGVTRKFAEDFWSDLEGFADYAFNKSHGACYALIAYQTAYLKAHYPSAFMAALLTSHYQDTDRIAVELAECQRLGIEVLPPDINESYVEFAVRPEDEAIRFGLAAIKNVGVGAVEKILEAREDGGEFTSVGDFAQRVSTSQVNRKTWESLIKAGAFDSFTQRSTLLYNLDMILAHSQKAQREAEVGQINMFNNGQSQTEVAQLSLEEPAETPAKRQRLQWERELLGIYLSDHPLRAYREYLERETIPIREITEEMEGQKQTIGGIITAVKSITTKNGAPMAFVTIEDLDSSLELVVFPNAYDDYRQLWQEDQLAIVKGKVSTKDRDGNRGSEIKILVNHAQALNKELVEKADKSNSSSKSSKASKDQASKQEQSNSPQKPTAQPKQAPKAEPAEADNSPTTVMVTLPNSQDQQVLVNLKKVINKHQGQSPVLVKLKDNSRTIRLPDKVDPDNGLRDELAEIVGEDQITIK